ncbi:hypothetical protein FA13DRAFT_1708370 [Coprinellus micaceus]|uniref:Uncharacterized protein n=1 Tax=Coprinellus micaceus TaxID=71717 RepID=A0A4Y7TI26_COPMI|nr:hypothetical protein FA13DRAFT_1708370 [Coprinellus micaceus]
MEDTDGRLQTLTGPLKAPQALTFGKGGISQAIRDAKVVEAKGRGALRSRSRKGRAALGGGKNGVHEELGSAEDEDRHEPYPRSSNPTKEVAASGSSFGVGLRLPRTRSPVYSGFVERFPSASPALVAARRVDKGLVGSWGEPDRAGWAIVAGTQGYDEVNGGVMWNRCSSSLGCCTSMVDINDANRFEVLAMGPVDLVPSRITVM